MYLYSENNLEHDDDFIDDMMENKEKPLEEEVYEGSEFNPVNELVFYETRNKINEKSYTYLDIKDYFNNRYDHRWFLSYPIIIFAFFFFIFPGLILANRRAIYILRMKEEIRSFTTENIFRYFSETYKDFIPIDWVYKFPHGEEQDPNFINATKVAPYGVSDKSEPIVSPGILVSIFGKEIALSSVKWFWRATDFSQIKLGESSHSSIVLSCGQIPNKYNNFSLSIVTKFDIMNAKLNWIPGNDRLGSSTFNDLFGYKATDPMILRSIMQPQTQALFIDHWFPPKFLKMYAPELRIVDGTFILTSKLKKGQRLPFDYTLPLCFSKKKTEKSFVNNFYTDIWKIQHLILCAAMVRKIIK